MTTFERGGARTSVVEAPSRWNCWILAGFLLDGRCRERVGERKRPCDQGLFLERVTGLEPATFTLAR